MGLRSIEKIFVYKLSYERVFKEVKNALSDCKFKIKEADESSGKINASAGISIWSWGENINILVSKTSEGTQVDAYSGTKLQLIDWGKTRKNITNFFAALNKRLNK